MGTPRAEGGCPASAGEWLRLLGIVLQLGLILVATHLFQVESQAFWSLSILVTGGFVVHALLPLRFRMAFFALLSLVGIGVVLGPYNAAWVIALGLAVITLCCLPLSLFAQVGLLLAAGGILAAMRADWLHAPWSSAIWPVFGSMFMFRTMMFLYDRRHGEKPNSVWETISYFFLLPNVCFPLFPLVDYATFRRTSHGEPIWDCYQTGIRWIARGLLHLVLYRLIYYHGLLAPSEVASAGDLARYMVTTISLYLRVSGVFHIAIGILRLFGFALPETHFLYFFCGSINDFWRRANIYWKDFMLKLFYLPAYFRFRKLGENKALVYSTLIVVFATWVLHSYQVFWLQGSFPVKWQDGVFWAMLGTLMILNTLHERKKSRARGPARARLQHPTPLVGRRDLRLPVDLVVPVDLRNVRRLAGDVDASRRRRAARRAAAARLAGDARSSGCSVPGRSRGGIHQQQGRAEWAAVRAQRGTDLGVAPRADRGRNATGVHQHRRVVLPDRPGPAVGAAQPPRRGQPPARLLRGPPRRRPVQLRAVARLQVEARRLAGAARDAGASEHLRLPALRAEAVAGHPVQGRAVLGQSLGDARSRLHP